MINTKETCELVNSSQIRNYIVNYLIKYNSKDFIDFISANPNKRKVFISFGYNIDFKPSTFVLRTATDYHTSLGLVACYAVAMPPRKVVQNGHMSKITKSIFTEYTQMLNNNDLLDIYDKISDYEEPENIALENKLRKWIFTSIMAFNPINFNIDDISSQYKDELSCYLLEANQADWDNMPGNIFIKLVKYYYYEFTDSPLTALVIKKLEERAETLIENDVSIFTEEYLGLYTKSKYALKPLMLPFPNNFSDYSIDTIATICKNKPVILTMGKKKENTVFAELCKADVWYSLDQACSTGNCHFKKETFKKMVNALPTLKEVPLDIIMLRSACKSLDLIKKYSI